MIDHVSLPVRDLSSAAAFYDDVLATLGLGRQRERDEAVGYGPGDPLPPVFWILARSELGAARPGIGLHVSFRARDRDEVHAFHRIALQRGGRTAGEPGPRPAYSAGFYGCFVIDLDGFKIEAVLREALGS